MRINARMAVLRIISTVKEMPFSPGQNLRRCIEDVNLVPMNEIPIARRVRIQGCALEHQCCRAVNQRAVHNLPIERMFRGSVM